MKNKKSTALLLALLMMASVFLNATSVFAEGKQEAPRVNQLVKKAEEVKAEDKKDDSEEVKARGDELEISGEEAPDAVGGSAADKTFTVTKKSGETTTAVGGYDKFYDAVGAMDVNDAESEYTIYLNKDTTVPKEEMGGYYRSKNKFRLTSGQGGPYTLTREGEWGILGIGDKSELTVDNITLDGNKTCQCFFISNNGKVTLGKGATIQNFIDSSKENGPAIYLTGGTLNIEEGAIIQNNKGNSMGGVIGDNSSKTTININGGTFTGNSSVKWGGVIGSFGKVTINGGTFTGNQAGLSGGVIYSNGELTVNDGIFSGNFVTGNNGTGGVLATGTKAKLNVNGGTFKGNSAKFGSAIYTSNTQNALIKNATIESNVSGFGAIYFNGGSANIENVSFNNNLAFNRGSAIYNLSLIHI